jgi:hypothetical protein
MPRSLQKHTASQQHHSTQVQVQQTLGQSIKQGFGISIGSHMAHAILGSIGRPTDPQPTAESKATKEIKGYKEYNQCMTENNDDKAACAHLLQKE